MEGKPIKNSAESIKEIYDFISFHFKLYDDGQVKLYYDGHAHLKPMIIVPQDKPRRAPT